MAPSHRWPKQVERLLAYRTVLLESPIDRESAETTVALILFLGMEDKKKPLHLLIDSPGGYIFGSFAIYDVMSKPGPPIHTHCLGSAHGTAALLLAAGSKGHRTCSSRASCKLVPLGAPSSSKAEKDVLERKLAKEFSRHSGREEEEVLRDISEGRVLSAKDAIRYGLVDSVLEEVPGISALQR